ncbi:MAG: glycosyltransferase family 2 protein [Planctomycetaceae bacterium]|jgi:glycosyltransferase involved in cell wall biosynthesis|nr:glycosyltransferase family 2 protein [Planctomycetaceae bacterium]
MFNKPNIKIQPTIKIAVVIPCYKVEKHLESVIEGIPDFIDTIILVDDESPDNTPELVDRLAEQFPNHVVALHHDVNQGVGGATMTGMKHAVTLGANIIVKMDGDGQMDPAYLPALIEPLLQEKADFTKGSRFTNAEVLQKMPLVRLIGNAGLSFLNRIASGYWNVLDPTNGYFAIRAEIVGQLPEHRIHKRYFYESSQLIELGILRAVVQDVPMRTIYGDEVSNLSIKKTLLEFPPKLFAGFCRRIWLTKILLTTSPDIILGILGILLMLFGVTFGSYKWIFGSIIEGQIATAGAVMFAALPCIMGLQMLLSALLIDIQSVPTQQISQHLSFHQNFLINEKKNDTKISVKQRAA